MNETLTKIFRYIRILGVRRTFVKICGRKRIARAPFFMLFRKKPRIGVIGCGQFSFSTIGYFIYSRTRERFKICFDIDNHASESFARFYRVPKVAEKAEDVFNDPDVDVVYIASNHHTHTTYALEAMSNHKNIHIEKPIAVNWEQFYRLNRMVETYGKTVVAGYNRPFAQAIQIIDRRIAGRNLPLTLNCFIAGHRINPDHWYRNPGEGGRICGNVGHWLDLAVHLLMQRDNYPHKFSIGLSWADVEQEPDDNFCISMSSDAGDIISVTLTARAEPLEGIQEYIQMQSGELIVSIYDFREMRLWEKSYFRHRKFRPKDVGHSGSILQVLRPEKFKRPWDEVRLSTAIMLFIHDMAEKKESQREFDLDEILCRLDRLNSITE